MYAEVSCVLVSLETQVQPQIIPNPDYLPGYLSVSYDYNLSVDYYGVDYYVDYYRVDYYRVDYYSVDYYRVEIHSEMRTWHDKNIQSNAPYR